MQPTTWHYTSPVIQEVHAEVENPPRVPPTLRESVLAMAEEEGVDVELVENIITCESQWNPDADNGDDRGLWQYNRKWRADVTDEQAFNPLEATKIALNDIKDGKSHQWVCANCYLYIKAYFYPDLPKMADITPNSFAHEGAIAIFEYSNGVKHLAYIDRFENEYFVVKEANYIKGLIAERNVEYNDPFIVGFYSP